MLIRDTFSMVCGVAGIGLCAYGSWLIHPAAGFIVPGGALVLMSFLISRMKG